MSRINNLIKNLCHSGVKYYILDDIADIFVGLATSVTKYKQSEGVVLLHNSDIKQNKIVLKNIEFISKDFADKNKGKYHQLNDIITVHTGDVGTSAVITDEYVGSMGFTTLVTRIKDFNLVNQYYLCHYFNSDLCKQDIAKVTISDRSNLNQKEFCKLLIPIPPLEVQKEIVRILDKFSELEAELKAELEAELEARKSQYEFWRGKLLNNDKYKAVKVNDISYSVSSGKCSSRNNEGLYPVYGSTGIIAKTDEYLFDTDKLLIARVGANAGYVHIANGKYNVTDNTLIVDLKEDVDLRFIYYYLQNYNLNKLAKGGGQPLITGGQIKELEINLPPLQEQKRISNILDKFDDLVNDISVGLPAEIELRRKQYEYYRNKLLAFEEI